MGKGGAGAAVTESEPPADKRIRICACLVGTLLRIQAGPTLEVSLDTGSFEAMLAFFNAASQRSSSADIEKPCGTDQLCCLAASRSLS